MTATRLYLGSLAISYHCGGNRNSGQGWISGFWECRADMRLIPDLRSVTTPLSATKARLVLFVSLRDLCQFIISPPLHFS